MNVADSKPWVEGLTIGQVLSRTRDLNAAGEALVFPKLNLRKTWEAFVAEIEQLAHGLLALGIRKGDHVAIWATNVPQWVVLQFATARMGAVLVTVNPAYRPFELKYVLQKSDAKALFLVDGFKSSDYFAILNEVCPEAAESQPGELSCDEFPTLRHLVAIKGNPLPGMWTWNEVMSRGADAKGSRFEDLSPDEPINIQYTSGTTGFPKAAMLSHHNLLLNAYYVGDCQNLTNDDRICIPVPFYHCFGCVLGTLCAAVHGATMVIPGEYFQPTDVLDAVEKTRATVIYGVPTMFIAELEDPTFASRDLSSLRTGIMSGSPCPIEVMRRVINDMAAGELTIAYGQTEASPVVTQTRTADPIELRVETVGRPLPGVEVKIVDPATGQTLGDDQQGELCCRGHVVMLGYYNDAAATAEAIDADGWLHSGDLAIRRPNGYYRITGRIRDMVIRGGENIYPREIEEFLFTHPAIEQVAVVGVPDEKYGEALCAWVKLKADSQLTGEELLEFCRAHIAHYKVPKYVKFVDAFPQTVTGKIQKFKIREAMMLEFGLCKPETA